MTRARYQPTFARWCFVSSSLQLAEFKSYIDLCKELSCGSHCVFLVCL